MIDRSEIVAAAARIDGRVRRTPVMTLAPGELLPDHSVTLKLEQLQHSASFKTRGAFNAMLSTPVPDSGVIAASGGNHGAAVAFAARALGHRAEIFVPSIVSPAKRARLKSYGAAVTVAGDEFAEALEACRARQAETGATLYHAYDQPDIVAGQGTVGREFDDQAPWIDSLLIAVGGGGLIGGIASWYRGDVRLVAVEGEKTNALNAAMGAGTPVDVPVSGLTADSLGARQVGGIGFAAAQAFVSDTVLVSDAKIRETQAMLWDHFRMIVEPGGAAALAALMAGAYTPAEGEHVGVLVCGANTDPATILGGAS